MESIFEDFRIFFQSRPVPGLYLKPFKSYSQSKTTTILSTWQNTKSWKKSFVSFSYEITYEKLSTIFTVTGILKIFEFSFILD